MAGVLQLFAEVRPCCKGLQMAAVAGFHFRTDCAYSAHSVLCKPGCVCASWLPAFGPACCKPAPIAALLRVAAGGARAGAASGQIGPRSAAGMLLEGLMLLVLKCDRRATCAAVAFRLAGASVPRSAPFLAQHVGELEVLNSGNRTLPRPHSTLCCSTALQVLSALEHRNDNPSAIPGRELAKMIYGKGSVFARDPTPEQVCFLAVSGL